MLYHFLKIIAWFGIRIFCRKIILNKAEILNEKGPLLLACNHPNSFLDSVILNTIFENPVWSLARGDVFKNPFYIKLLTSLKILPVYRTSEGVENLSENYKTFDACINIFRANGIVTIYCEGKCINEWHLRPLKKGTARLAIKAWEENIPLRVLPVGINYNSFRLFGKNVFINFGEVITREIIEQSEADGLRHQSFNNSLQKQLKQLVFEIPKQDCEQQKKRLTVNISLVKRILLFIPAIFGLLINAPLYLPIKKFSLHRTKGTDHFDSVMAGILLLTYPLYLLLLTVLLLVLTKSYWSLTLILFVPFTAWCFVQIKKQTGR